MKRTRVQNQCVRMGLRLCFIMWSFFALCIHCSLSELEDDYDWDNEANQNWVDPTDMLNYDLGTQAMKKPAAAQGIKKTSENFEHHGHKVNPSLENKQQPVSKEEKTLNNKRNQARQALPDLEKGNSGTGQQQGRTSGNQEKPTEEQKVSDVHTLDSSAEHAPVINDCSKLSSSLAALTTEKSYLQKELEECQAADTRPSSEKPYFKQYINVLLERFKKLGLPESGPMLYGIHVELTKEEIRILQKYTDDKHSGVQDAHSILVHMIKGSHIVYSDEASFELSENAKMRLSLVAQICLVVSTALIGLFVYVKLELAWTQLFFKVLVLMFFISIPWNWWHLYKVEIASRQATAMQDAPAECRPEKLGYWHSFSALFSIESNKCAKYYEKLLVDPVWEVPPTKAVAVTLAKFFLEPLKHIGEHLGLFIKASLHDLPVQLWPFVFAFTIFMLSVVVIMSFGYKIRLFYLFGLEPGHRAGEQAAGMVQQSIQDLKGEIKKLADAPAEPVRSQSSVAALEERIEDIVYQAVQSALPPALSRAEQPADSIPALAFSVQNPETLQQIEYVSSAVETETVDAVTQSSLSGEVQSVETVVIKRVETVEAQTQSSPEPKKKLSSSHVAVYSYPGTTVEPPDENKMEKTVTRQSSVVMRDNWSQTWITSGLNGKFSDLDEKTFCDVHATWKPYQKAYYPDYYQDEDYQSSVDSSSDTCLGAYSARNVVSARPESRNSTQKGSEGQSVSPSAICVPPDVSSIPGYSLSHPGVEPLDSMSSGDALPSKNSTALNLHTQNRTAPGPVETMFPSIGH